MKRPSHWHGVTKHEHAYDPDNPHAHGAEMWEDSVDAGEEFVDGEPAPTNLPVFEGAKTYKVPDGTTA